MYSQSSQQHPYSANVSDSTAKPAATGTTASILPTEATKPSSLTGSSGVAGLYCPTGCTTIHTHNYRTASILPGHSTTGYSSTTTDYCAADCSLNHSHNHRVANNITSGLAQATDPVNNWGDKLATKPREDTDYVREGFEKATAKLTGSKSSTTASTTTTTTSSSSVFPSSSTYSGGYPVVGSTTYCPTGCTTIHSHNYRTTSVLPGTSTTTGYTSGYTAPVVGSTNSTSTSYCASDCSLNHEHNHRVANNITSGLAQATDPNENWGDKLATKAHEATDVIREGFEKITSKIMGKKSGTTSSSTTTTTSSSNKA